LALLFVAGSSTTSSSGSATRNVRSPVPMLNAEVPVNAVSHVLEHKNPAMIP
jgi:hypothetical protein